MTTPCALDGIRGIDLTQVMAGPFCGMRRAGPIHGVPEPLADPHARAEGMVRADDDPGVGRVKALGIPLTLSRSPARLAGGAN
jgi:crotonobetainyl-CoA:carnitine CoA-transferase CaiB-like acyl-CoA transferase